ncbi:MAG: hypothetical protein V2A58_06095 [Planctomycetota bacterium]
MSLADSVRCLLHEAFELIDEPRCPVSKLIRKAARIARLREDADALIWLEWELTDGTIQQGRMTVLREILKERIGHYSVDELRQVSKRTLEEWLRHREIRMWKLDGSLESEPRVVLFSVPQLENTIKDLRSTSARALDPDPPHLAEFYQPLARANAKVDSRIYYDATATEFERVLDRVRQRVYDFLSRTEREIEKGETCSGLIQRNAEYVEKRLQDLAPVALEQMQAAPTRLSDGTCESRSHALTSCRRALKSLADVLYPPSKEQVLGSDGKTRKLTDEKYASRLLQFIHENVGSTASSRLLEQELSGLANRLDRAHDLVNKGVHAKVTAQEAEQGVIQTYLVIGDILRVKEGNSALSDEA